MALTETESYKDAVELLSKTPIAAPCYFIVSGVQKNEGVILSRSYDTLVEKDELDVDNGKWFLVQTNSDRHERCTRREAAETRLKEMKKTNLQVNYDNLMDGVMKLSPNKNAGTIYSTIQGVAGTGYLKSQYWIEGSDSTSSKIEFLFSKNLRN
jgi:hypothetical protein